MKQGTLYLFKKGRAFIVKHPQLIPHFNGNKLISSTSIRTVGWYFFGLLWLLTAIEMGKTYISNNLRENVDAYFAIVETYLAEQCWLNLMISSTSLLIWIIWLKYVIQDRYLSLKRMTIATCLITIFLFADTFTKVHSAFAIDYAALFRYLFFIQLSIDIIKLWYRRWNVSTPGRAKLKYITDLPKENLDEKVRLDYSKKVTEWLFNTDISESAFALGITSEWGSGKTSFLLDIKKVMEDRCYQIDFKPWHCQTPDQIVNEFFELFRRTIKNVYSPLSKPIVRYSQLLSDTGLPVYVKLLFRFFPETGYSIESYKSKIERGLKQLDKPVVVTIDDMDRLAADELFEVLRLIRNTAAFPNLIYVVCYDKAYVVKQIANMGIDESDLYLEKIFPLELSLPKTEDESLIETFRRAMIDMHFLQGKHDILRNKLTADDELMIVRLLPTYRKIKRFARVLMTNTMFLMDKLGRKNVDLYDIFLIELLHFCMQEVYVVLRDTPEEVLSVQIDDMTKQARYILVPDNKLNEVLNDRIGRILDVYEAKLLKKCFEPRSGDKIHGLPYVDSYLNYICMTTPTANIAKEEFADVVSNRSSIRRNVHNWFFKLPVKNSASLYCRLMDVRIKELTREQWKDHLYLLYSWLCEDNFDMIKNVLAPYLLIDNIHSDAEDTIVLAQKYATAKLEIFINGIKVNRMNVARNLCGYFSLIEENEDNYLLNCQVIKEFLKLNFKHYIEEKQVHQDAINVVALNENDLNAFVKAHDIIATFRNLYGDYTHSHKNLIIDDVIEYFGAYTVKSSHYKEAEEIYDNKKNNRYRKKTFGKHFDLNEEKKSIFGDDAHYEELLNNCFFFEKNVE